MSDDIVIKPSHYTRWQLEPIEFILQNDMEFWRGNIIKYAARAGFKNYDGQDSTSSEITDLRKVMRYAEMRIEEIERQLEKEPKNEKVNLDDPRSFIERDIDSLRGWDIPS